MNQCVMSVEVGTITGLDACVGVGVSMKAGRSEVTSIVGQVATYMWDGWGSSNPFCLLFSFLHGHCASSNIQPMQGHIPYISSTN